MSLKKIYFGIVATVATSILSIAAFAVAAGPNLIQNSSFEAGSGNVATDWTTGSFGSSTVLFSIATTSVHTGNRAAQIDISAYTNGDAKWVHAPVTVAAGEYYTFGFWYKASAATSLYARYNDSDTDGVSTGFHWLAGLPSTGGTWTEYTDTITIPSGVTKLQLIQTLETVGSLTIDDHSLTLDTAPVFSEGRVTLTFDDGWQSIYDNARPILNSAGVKTTQYIYSDAMNQAHGSIYMTAAELLDMQAEGHDIAAHSRTHANLTSSSTNLASEIAGSRSDLIAAGFSPVNSYAYPFGAYNSTVRQQMIDAGFLGARTVEQGYNYTNTDAYDLKIQHVTNTTTATDIKGWIETARQNKTWLILMFHEVKTASSSCIGTDSIECSTAETLEEVAMYITAPATEICVLTMSQALTNAPCGPTPNNAPVVANPIADKNATEGTLFTFSFPENTFTDADTDTLTYSTEALPSWLAFATTTRTFSGTPSNADVGTHSITLYAVDPSSATATDTFDIIVANNNGAPSIEEASFTIAENSASLAVVGTTTASDADVGDTLTYALVSGNINNAFTLDATTGVITVSNSSALDFETTPAFSLLISVTDASALSAQATTTITLTDVSETTPAPAPQPAQNGSGGGGGNGGGIVLGLIGTITTNFSNIVPQTTNNGVVLGTTTISFLFTKPLYWGVQGNDVIELHKILIALGYLKISAPTGYFGPLTFAAVKEYQQEHDIDTVGMVGPITRASLNSR